MSSARGALTVVGQVVGAYFGGPIGAAIGGQIGGAIGGAIDGPVRNTQSLISDMNAIKANYGDTWTRMYGRYPFIVAPLWSSTKRAIPHDEEVDAKGGPAAVNTTFTYEQDWIAWAPLGSQGILRVWVNGELKYNVSPDATEADLTASANTDAWASIEFADGAADQPVWSVHEAAVGTENCIAYRHRPTVRIESLNLGPSGQPPVIKIEFLDQPTNAPTAITGFVDAQAGVMGDELTAEMIAAVEVGDALYIYAHHSNTTAIITWPTGWSPTAAGGTDALGQTRLRGARRIADGTSADTDISFSCDTPSAAVSFTYIILRGVDPDYVGPTYYTNGTTLNPTAITPANGTEWLNVCVAISSCFNLDIGGPYGEVELVAGPSGYQVATSGIGQEYPANNRSLKTMLVAYAQEAPQLTNATENPGAFSATGSNGTNAFAFHFMRLPFLSNEASEETDGVDLADIVSSEALLTWTGEDGSLVAGDIDVTELAGTMVRGFATTGSPRESIAMLMDDWYFGSSCSDKVYFRFRGAEEVKTLAFEDTGAGVGQPGEPFTGMDRGNDLEVAIQVALTGPGLYRDYDPQTEHSDRLEGESFELRTAQTACIFTPTELKGRADTRVYDARVAAHTAKLSLDDRHVDLEPFDVVNATDDEGSVFRVRIERETYNDGVREFDVVLDDPSVLSESGITAESDDRAITIAVPGETEIVLFDAPTLGDPYDYAGPLIAVVGTGRWPGAAVIKSVDESSWTRVATIVESAVAGHTETAPIDWPEVPASGIGGNFFDRTSVIRVQLISGTLTSTTRAAVIADPWENLFALKKADGTVEMFQAVNCDLVTTGVYDLSMLLRGRFGTEQNTSDHETAESIALMTTAGFAKPVIGTSEIGAERFWKGVTLGGNADLAVSRDHTNQGVALKPYAVAHPRATDNGDGTFTLTWARRSRLECRVMGPLGTSVPLGEETESYSLDVYDDTDVLQDTVTASDETADVTAVAGWRVVIYQVSATVGRGYPTEITL